MDPRVMWENTMHRKFVGVSALLLLPGLVACGKSEPTANTQAPDTRAGFKAAPASAPSITASANAAALLLGVATPPPMPPTSAAAQTAAMKVAADAAAQARQAMQEMKR